MWYRVGLYLYFLLTWAALVTDEELAEDYVVANAFDKRVPLAVAKAVAETAIKTGVARKTEVPY